MIIIPGERYHSSGGRAGPGGGPAERPTGSTPGHHGGLHDLHGGLAHHGLRQGQVRPAGRQGRRRGRHW